MADIEERKLRNKEKNRILKEKYGIIKQVYKKQKDGKTIYTRYETPGTKVYIPYSIEKDGKIRSDIDYFLNFLPCKESDNIILDNNIDIPRFGTSVGISTNEVSYEYIPDPTNTEQILKAALGDDSFG